MWVQEDTDVSAEIAYVPALMLLAEMRTVSTTGKLSPCFLCLCGPADSVACVGADVCFGCLGSLAKQLYEVCPVPVTLIHFLGHFLQRAVARTPVSMA